MKEYGNVWRDCILKAQKRITGSKYRGANKKNIKVEKDTESKSISTNKDTFDNVVINRRMTRQLVKMATICKVKLMVKKKAYQKKGRPYRYYFFVGCKRNNHHDVSFKRITPIPSYEIIESDRYE